MAEATLFHDPLNVIVCGVGGQGNVMAARLAGKVLAKLGYEIAIGETYGVSQRGGAVMSHVRVSKGRAYSPLIPHGRAHIVVGLEPMETLRILSEYGNPEVVCVVNTRPLPPVTVGMGVAEYPEWEDLSGALDRLSSKTWYVPATEVAMELGAPIVSNIVMLGALVGTNLLPGTMDQYRDMVRETLPDRSIGLNLQALERGQTAVQGALTS